MSWRKIKLGECCKKIGSGSTPKGGERVYTSSGIAFIRSQNVYNLNFDYGGLVFINNETAQKLNGVTVKENDVLINITGDSVARTCIVPSDVLPARVNQHVSIIRPDSRIICPKFLNYYLASPFMQTFMLGLAVGKGASRNAITKSMIANFDVPYPPLETQQRIASILSAYDDLIDNNRRQIKLLEEAVQRLYKEWFVDLRFPGHENVKVVDGVPEGWRSIPLSTVISYEIGGGWGEEFAGKNELEAFVVRGTDLAGLTNGSILSVPLRFHAKSNLTPRILQNGDIIFEVSGGSRTEGVARTARITTPLLKRWNKPVMCASFCKIIRPIENISQFLFDHLQYLRKSKQTEKFDKRSASSIINFRWKDFLSQQNMMMPDANILAKYNSMSETMYERTIGLSLQIETAIDARDRLLPKLMSGEIEV